MPVAFQRTGSWSQRGLVWNLKRSCCNMFLKLCHPPHQRLILFHQSYDMCPSIQLEVLIKLIHSKLFPTKLTSDLLVALMFGVQWKLLQRFLVTFAALAIDAFGKAGVLVPSWALWVQGYFGTSRASNHEVGDSACFWGGCPDLPCIPATCRTITTICSAWSPTIITKQLIALMSTSLLISHTRNTIIQKASFCPLAIFAFSQLCSGPRFHHILFGSKCKTSISNDQIIFALSTYAVSVGFVTCLLTVPSDTNPSLGI